MNKTHRVEKGLVLRATPYKDADVMLTLLTECSGKLSVMARGARRRGSRLTAAVEPLAYSEFTLYSSGSTYLLNEGEPIELFYNLRSDLEALTLGNYFAEVIDRASDAEFVDPYLLRLILNSLYALSKKIADPRIVKAAFELRVACLAGYQPNVFTCGGCGCEARGGRFSIANSAIYCEGCNGSGVPIDSGTLMAMQYIIGSEINRLFSFKLSESGIKTLSKISEQYLSYHFGCEFKSLSLYKTLFKD